MERFFKSNRVYAIAGASTNPAKFGNKVSNWYKTHNIPAVPINPKKETINGIPSVATLEEVPVPSGFDMAISVVTPPAATKQLIESFNHAKGKVSSIWLQPGTYTDDVLQLARQNVPDVITDCILVNGDKYYSKSLL